MLSARGCFERKPKPARLAFVVATIMPMSGKVQSVAAQGRFMRAAAAGLCLRLTVVQLLLLHVLATSASSFRQ